MESDRNGDERADLIDIAAYGLHRVYPRRIEQGMDRGNGSGVTEIRMVGSSYRMWYVVWDMGDPRASALDQGEGDKAKLDGITHLPIQNMESAGAGRTTYRLDRFTIATDYASHERDRQLPGTLRPLH